MGDASEESVGDSHSLGDDVLDELEGEAMGKTTQGNQWEMNRGGWWDPPSFCTSCVC